MNYTVKGETFQSELSSKEALHIVAGLDSQFAKSLTLQYVRNGQLSARQWPWVHKMAVDAMTPQKAAQELPDCSAIVSLFDFASEAGMKRPRITFPEAKFSLAGERSRVAGSIQVSQGSYPGKYFGYITPEGEFVPGRDFASLDLTFLEAFSKSPRAYAKSSGMESGSCRFCGLTLSTKESLSVGYGPVCASHWDLPWGKVSL